MLFRKKPVEIEANLFEGGAESGAKIVEWANDGEITWYPDGVLMGDPNCPTPEYHETHHYCPSCPWNDLPEHLTIETLEGRMTASVGDWVIQGVQDEFYPCKPDVFEKTYDAVD